MTARARVPIDEAIRLATDRRNECWRGYLVNIEDQPAADACFAAIKTLADLCALRASGVTEVDGETP